MHLYYDPPDFIALANTARHTLPDPQDDAEFHALFPHGDTSTQAPSSRSAIGQILYDPETRTPLGILVEAENGDLLLQGFQTPSGSSSLVPFRPGNYMIGSGQILSIGTNGFFVGDPFRPATGDGGAAAAAAARAAARAAAAALFQNSLTFLREQERLLRERGEIDAARSLANSLVFLEQQHRNALELDDINATRNLVDQLTIIAQQHRNALERNDINATRDLESQLTVLAETYRLRAAELEQTQTFTAEENKLSRENQIRLQRLDELAGLQRQVLSDRARGRELLAQTIGVDPIRSSALAQGIVPRGGTPADLFRTQLQETVDQPLVQPTSFDIGDIESAIKQSQEGLGLPPQPTIGFARGGVIDMKKSGNGKFRVLVGERGPELLEGDANTIQITPIRSAAHGATIGRNPVSFNESPFVTFGDLPGTDFTFGGGRPPPRPVPTRPSPTITSAPMATGGDLSLASAFDPTAPFVEQPQPLSFPVSPGVSPNPLAGFPPEGGVPLAHGPGAPLSPSGGAPADGEGPFAGLSVADVLTLSNAGLVSIGKLVAQSLAGLPLDYNAAFAGLTANDVLTLARMGYTGLSQILAESLVGFPPEGGVPPPPPAPPPPDFVPPGGELTQGIESIFAHLGLDQVPTFTEGPQGGMLLPPGGLSVFDRLGISPSLFRVLDPASQEMSVARNFFVSPSGELQFIGSSRKGSENPALTSSGFRPEDFLTVSSADLFNAGFGTGADAPIFTGQPLATGQNPFPLPRLPLSIGSDVTGGAGFFLPDPRTIASFFRRLDPATQNLLLNFYSGAGLGGESVQRTFDFFSPTGTFDPSQVAGFG